MSDTDEWRESVKPSPTNEALDNPGMGWVHHYYGNSLEKYNQRMRSDDVLEYFPGLRVAYFRIPWCYVEPEEGEYNWSAVDGPAQRFIDAGNTIALRFTCFESHEGRYPTPEWVEEAGADGYLRTPAEAPDWVLGDDPVWQPDFSDPVFLDKLDDFLATLAERYDGNPDVEFVDVGSYGVWSECYPPSVVDDDPIETIKRHVDLHVKHFDETPLVINDSVAQFPERNEPKPDVWTEAIDYAREQGLTFRDDSVLVAGWDDEHVQWNIDMSSELADDFWPDRPVVLESCHYGPSVESGTWVDETYLEAVERYRASYASIHWHPREFYDECSDLIDRINERLGYRIRLLEASWPETIGSGKSWSIETAWRNEGVAPCHVGGHPAATLRDDDGGIASVFVDEEFGVADVPVAEDPQDDPTLVEPIRRTSRFHSPDVARLDPGSYELSVSIGAADGTPTLELPIDLPTDGNRRYRLGEMTVR